MVPPSLLRVYFYYYCITLPFHLGWKIANLIFTEDESPLAPGDVKVIQIQHHCGFSSYLHSGRELRGPRRDNVDAGLWCALVTALSDGHRCIRGGSWGVLRVYDHTD